MQISIKKYELNSLNLIVYSLVRYCGTVPAYPLSVLFNLSLKSCT